MIFLLNQYVFLGEYAKNTTHLNAGTFKYLINFSAHFFGAFKITVHMVQFTMKINSVTKNFCSLASNIARFFDSFKNC